MAKKKKTLPLTSTEGRVGRSVRKALEALGLGDAPKPSKYRNKSVEIDGERFDSKKEASRWMELRALEKVGVIRDLKRQVKYPLTVNGQLICGYTADFTYFDVEKGRATVEDAKGVRTPAYIIKRKLMLALRGIKIVET